MTSASNSLGDRLVPERVDDRQVAPGLDVLGELTQDELAERRQVVEPEEVLERRLGLRWRVHLPGP